ncbi:MAG: hypothetical protein K2J77_11725 [Oscillospiraceae bacterium]|nr:hypothetical protein [Oscillospiraceae bacterium]
MKKLSLKKFRRLPRYQQFLVGVLVVVVAFVIWLITRLTPSRAGVSLKITADCDNVGEIWCDFSLGGRDLGTMFAGVEDNDAHVPFERGEVVSMNIPAEAFDNKTRLRAEKFKFALIVFDTNGEGHPVRCENAEFFAEFGGKYSFTLTSVDGEYFCF